MARVPACAARRPLTRREALTLALAAPGLTTRLRGQEPAGPAESRLRGAFMILHTPFTLAGQIDWDDLAREAAFVDRAGAQGVVWPQGSSGVAFLSKTERLEGMTRLAETMRGRHAALVLGVQGRDTEEMLEYAQHAERLAPTAVIAMPPSAATSMDDYEAYFRALGRTARRPVIVQTSGGTRELVPSTELIVALAREFPHFGYVKEESDPVVARMLAEVAARPPMRGVFGASFGVGWLYEMRLGLDGVITGNAMYADLMARIWALHEAGHDAALAQAFATFLLLRNLNDQIAGVDLYVMKARGLFKTTAVRRSHPDAGPVRVAESILSVQERAEVDARLAAAAAYFVP